MYIFYIIDIYIYAHFQKSVLCIRLSRLNGSDHACVFLAALRQHRRKQQPALIYIRIYIF